MKGRGDLCAVEDGDEDDLGWERSCLEGDVCEGVSRSPDRRVLVEDASRFDESELRCLEEGFSEDLEEPDDFSERVSVFFEGCGS